MSQIFWETSWTWHCSCFAMKEMLVFLTSSSSTFHLFNFLDLQITLFYYLFVKFNCRYLTKIFFFVFVMKCWLYLRRLLPPSIFVLSCLHGKALLIFHWTESHFSYCGSNPASWNNKKNLTTFIIADVYECRRWILTWNMRSRAESQAQQQLLARGVRINE